MSSDFRGHLSRAAHSSLAPDTLILAGHSNFAAHSPLAGEDIDELISDDHCNGATPTARVVRIPNTDAPSNIAEHGPLIDSVGPLSDVDLTRRDTQTRVVDIAPIIDVIVTEHMRRQAAIKAQRRLDQAMGAMARRLCGWRVDLDEKERTRLNKRAERIVKALEKGTDLLGEDAQIAAALLPFVTASLQGRQPFDVLRKGSEKTMAEYARQLPAWSFIEAIRGVDAGGLAAIVGEAGDLSNYATPAKLWKRLGLAVIDGKRQGAPGKQASAEDWIRHGYSGRRRSVCWNVGYALVMCNKDGRYRTLFLARKEYEKARDPEMSKAHANNRAQRYMEKRFVLDLWKAWRAAARGEPCPQ